MVDVNTNPETQAAYNTNPQLTNMREDVANRGFNIKVKGWLITGATALLGLGIGALFLTAVGPMALIAGAGLGLMAGGTVAEIATMKDRKKLAIDEEMVGSYMQGKNYWGEGYRKEVAEYGYGGEQVPAPRNNLPPFADRAQSSRNTHPGRQ